MERTPLDLLTVVVSPNAWRLHDELIKHHGSEEAANNWLVAPNNNLNSMAPQVVIELGMRNQTDKHIIVVLLVHYHETGDWDAFDALIEASEREFPDLARYRQNIPQAS